MTGETFANIIKFTPIAMLVLPIAIVDLEKVIRGVYEKTKLKYAKGVKCGNSL